MCIVDGISQDSEHVQSNTATTQQRFGGMEGWSLMERGYWDAREGLDSNLSPANVDFMATNDGLEGMLPLNAFDGW